MKIQAILCATALMGAVPSFGSPVYGVMFRIGSQTSGLNPKLYDVNPLTGAATNPRNVSVNDCVGIAMNGAGDLYGLTDQFGRINNTAGQGGKNLLFKIDPATGAATAVGRLDPTGNFQEFEGDIAFQPSSGVLWGVTTQVTQATLFTIDTATGLATTRSAISLGGVEQFDLSAMAFASNGSLWALDTRYPVTGQGGPARVFQVNPDTGAILQSYTTSVALGNCAGMTFDPTTGQLLIADGDTYGTGNLYRFDFTSHDLVTIGATGAAGGNYIGLSGLADAGRAGTLRACYYGGGPRTVPAAQAQIIRNNNRAGKAAPLILPVTFSPRALLASPVPETQPHSLCAARFLIAFFRCFRFQVELHFAIHIRQL